MNGGLLLDFCFAPNNFEGRFMIIFFRIITVVALVIALIWLYSDPKFDSAFAVAIALAAVIALFITPANKKKQPNQSQKIKDGSIGVQAGRDVKIGRIHTKKDVEDAE